LEDLNNPQIGLPPVALNIRAQASEYNPDAPDLWNRGPSFPPAARAMQMPMPRPPYFGFRGVNMPAFGMPGNPTGLPRELISVPVMDPNLSIGDTVPPQMKRRFESDDGMNANEGPKRKLPINARLGPRNNAGGMNMNAQQNCSLELRKIPRGLNAISHLNDHFSKFGKITNIQIAYENDPEAAIITFSSHAEANVAYRSTEAVLNNRFIKVFWHSGLGSSDNHSMSGPCGSLPKPSELSMRRYALPANSDNANNATTQQLTSQASTGSNSQDANTTNPNSLAPIVSKSTTFVSPASAAAQQAVMQERIKTAKFNLEKSELIKKKQKEQQQGVLQLANDIRQKKQELVQKNVAQMKELLVKLEKTDQLDPARAHLMETIKALQVIIDKLKHELEADSAHIVAKMQTTNPPQRRTKEQTQKELLDVELELISKEQHGDNDTYAIRKRYLELQKSLKRPGFIPSGGAGPRPQIVRPAVARFGSTSVDRRPTTLQISGFPIEESDAVLGHLKVTNKRLNHFNQ
jgi:RNA-binding protein 26